MNKRWISVAIVVLLAAAVAIAQPGPGRGPKALADYLQLSDQQITSWQQIQKDTAAAAKPLAENARDLQKQLHTALQAATPDPTAVGKIAVQLESVRSQIRSAHEAADAKRLAVLNADQKAKFQAFQAAVAFLKEHRPRANRGPAPFPGE